MQTVVFHSNVDVYWNNMSIDYRKRGSLSSCKKCGDAIIVDENTKESHSKETNHSQNAYFGELFIVSFLCVTHYLKSSIGSFLTSLLDSLQRPIGPSCLHFETLLGIKTGNCFVPGLGVKTNGVLQLSYANWT